MLNLYLLERSQYQYDESIGLLVVAGNEARARVLAKEYTISERGLGALANSLNEDDLIRFDELSPERRSRAQIRGEDPDDWLSANTMCTYCGLAEEGKSEGVIFESFKNG